MNDSDDGEALVYADDKPVDPTRVFSANYVTVAWYMCAVQGGALLVGFFVAVSMFNVAQSDRQGSNLGDMQIVPYAALSAFGLAALFIEISVWNRRVDDARTYMQKHRDEAAVPHGAEPIPDEVASFSQVSRMSR